MAARFYAPLASEPGQIVALPDEEARHLARVRRLGVGAEVQVFDGRGGEWRARVESAGARGVQVRLVEAVAPVPEPRVAVTLALALLKGDRMDDALRDAVMLGVAAVRPFGAARSAVPLGSAVARAAGGRWQRVAVAAAKQSGRAVVPVVHPPVPIGEILAEAGGARLLLVEPAVPGPARRVADLAAEPPPPVATLAVGPEGGWTTGELDAARALGWQLVRLGARTLRADAVPLVALTALLAAWQEL